MAPLAPALPKQGWIKLTPINQRRLANFKANRRGYWSFWIFLVIFVLSLFAEFIANDRPIVARYKGEWLFPVAVTYPEEKFGGFLARTDYRDPRHRRRDQRQRLDALAAGPLQLCDHQPRLAEAGAEPADLDAVGRRVQAAGGEARRSTCRDIEWNWLGTDDRGRDVLARVIYGFRISVLFGLTLALISSVIGIAAGACRAISAAGPTSSSSASSRSGPACPRSTC